MIWLMRTDLRIGVEKGGYDEEVLRLKLKCIEMY